MRNLAIDYADCLVSLEPRRRRRTAVWDLEPGIALPLRRRWLLGLSAIVPAALLAALGWRL